MINFKSFYRNNGFIFIISLFYFVWITFLLVLLTINPRKVTFYDVLGQSDVSTEYSSTLPLFRYILEPVISVTFILHNKFTWLFLFSIIYPFLRILYLGLKKTGKFSTTKLELITFLLRKILKILAEILLIGFLLIGIIIFIAYRILGYFVLDLILPFHLGTYLMLTVTGFTLLYYLIRLVFSNLKLKLIRSIDKVTKRMDKNFKKYMKSIGKELMYFSTLLFLLIGINLALISIHFTPHKINPINGLANDEFLFDFHSHTVMSDGWLTPEDRVLWYMDQGISGAAISDHNTISGALIAKEFVRRNNLDFIVIIAEEWTDHVNNIHVNYFGVEEEIVPLETYVSGGPIAMNISDMIHYIKSKGGFTIVNHYNYNKNPNGGFGVPYTLEQLRDWGVDGFELSNMGSVVEGYESIRTFCLNNSLICFGASDIHTNRDLNTFIKLQLDDPTNFTVANIFKNLKKNTHQIIIINLYNKQVSFPKDFNNFGFDILSDFCNYILNLNSFQALSWIIWTSGVYFLFIFSFRKIKKIDLHLNTFKDNLG